MSKLAIEWNEKADRYLAPLQRDAIERGEQPRRLEGKVELHPDGTVWYRSHGHKIIGTWNAPAQAERDASELDAPSHEDAVPAKSRKTASKRKRK